VGVEQRENFLIPGLEASVSETVFVTNWQYTVELLTLNSFS